MRALLLLLYILYILVPTCLVKDLNGPWLPDGKWGAWSFCKGNTVARGFRIKVNFPWISYFDNKGLTGIQLMCGNNSFPNYDNAPTSTYGIEDSQWQGVKMCGGNAYITSFDLRQENDKRWYILDHTGATNLKVKCSDGSILEGDGIEDKGFYHGWLNCPDGEGICGLKTKYDDGSENYLDSLGLVTVKMTCCRTEIKGQRTINDTYIHSNENANISLLSTVIFMLKKHPEYSPVALKKSSNTTIPNEEGKTLIGTHTKNIVADGMVLSVSENEDKSSRKSIFNKSKNMNKTVKITPILVAEPNTITAANISVVASENMNNTGETKMLKSKHKHGTVNMTTNTEKTPVKRMSTIQAISGFRDPYLNIPVALEVLVLVAAGIFFFFAGFFFKKIYSVKFEKKPYQWTMKDQEKIDPTKFTDVDISK